MLKKIFAIMALAKITNLSFSAEDSYSITRQIAANSQMVLARAESNSSASEIQWSKLVSASRVLSDMVADLGASAPINVAPLETLLPTVSTTTRKNIMQLIESSDRKDALLKLDNKELKDLAHAARLLEIPAILVPLREILAEQLQDPDNHWRKAFEKNPLDVINGLSKAGIDMSDTDLGFALIQPHLHELWRPAKQRTIFGARLALLNPNGTILASASDNTIDICHLHTGETKHIRAGRHITKLSWSPDGTMLASASRGHTIRIWDPQTGLTKHVLTDPVCYGLNHHHTSGIAWLRWSPDGATLASASDNNTICIWSREGQLVHSIACHTGPIWSLEWNCNGTTLASGSSDSSICIWDCEGHSVQSLDKHTAPISALMWSPDGAILASISSDGMVCIWDPYKNQLLRTCRTSHYNGKWLATWSRDSTMFASGSNNAIHVWHHRTNQLFDITATNDSYRNEAISRLTWSHDSTMLASKSHGGLIRIRSSRTGQLLHTLVDCSGTCSLAWSHDNTTLAAGSGHTVRLWDSRTGKILQVIVDADCHSSIDSFAWNPDDTLLITKSTDNTVSTWDMTPLLFAHRVAVLDSLVLLTLLQHPKWLIGSENLQASDLIKSLRWAKFVPTKTNTITAPMLFSVIAENQYEQKRQKIAYWLERTKTDINALQAQQTEPERLNQCRRLQEEEIELKQESQREKEELQRRLYSRNNSREVNVTPSSCSIS